MKKNSIKNWTILIYADGNNELEPEMLNSKLDAEKVGSSDNINVIMQIGRESRTLAKIIRPFDSMPVENEHWTGVRRYYIEKSKSLLVSDLRKINMADPHNLYNFITWGIKTYPAKHYMLILSGHGFSFIAAMTDLSFDLPYVMGVPQMCKVLNMIQKDTEVEIDLLVLDMCYMNTIEILYELGKNKNHTVKNTLTYIRTGPIKGLPYDKLIYTIEKNHSENNLFYVIKNIIDNIDLNLVAIKIDHAKLKNIKKIINKLAYSYLSSEKHKDIPPYEILYYLDKLTPWYQDALDLQKKLRELIIYYENKSITNYNIIDIVTEEMFLDIYELDNYTLFYYSLSFSKNNCWLNVLTKKSLDDPLYLNKINTAISLVPIITPLICIPQFIKVINPSLNNQDIRLILDKLLAYKKWDSNIILNEITDQLKTLYLPKHVSL